MTKEQRKLWAHKYGKSKGKQLIDFINNQEAVSPQPVAPYMIPITNRTAQKSKIQQGKQCFLNNVIFTLRVLIILLIRKQKR